MNEDIFGSEFLDEMKALEQEDKRPVTRRVADAIRAGEDVPVHPAAELFPMMNATDTDGWKGLIEDVRVNGCHQPLVVDHEGRLVDGRNRLAAIAELRGEGIDAPFEVVLCPKSDEAGIRSWVISTNLHRRHLTTSQRAAIAAGMVTATKSSGATARTKQVEHVTVDDAAKAMNVSPRQVKKAAQVHREAEKAGKPELVKAVREGKTTVNAAAKTLAEKPAPSKGKPTPPVEETVSALTDAQLASVRKIIAHASLNQLSMLKGAIVAQMRMLEKRTDDEK
jgi:hypothetical protein